MKWHNNFSGLSIVLSRIVFCKIASWNLISNSKHPRQNAAYPVQHLGHYIGTFGDEKHLKSDSPVNSAITLHLHPSFRSVSMLVATCACFIYKPRLHDTINLQYIWDFLWQYLPCFVTIAFTDNNYEHLIGQNILTFNA